MTMKRAFSTSIVTLLLLSFLPISAQEPLSLSEAIDIALKNNFQIQIADNNIDIAQTNNSWNEAGRYPSIAFNLNSQNGYTNRNDPSIVFQPELSTISTNASGNLDLAWVLFDGHKVRINKLRLEQLEQQSEGNAAVVVENAIQAVILAYYQAQIQLEQVNVLEEVLQLSNDRIEYQEVRKEFGQASTFDILQTKDAYLNDSTNYLLQLNAYEASLRNLNLAMGVEDLDRRYELTDPLVYAPEEFELDLLRERMLASNNNLRTLFINRELARSDRELQESNRAPRVLMNTGMTYSVNPRDNGDAVNFLTGEELGVTVARNFNYYLNFTLSYNLFDAGQRKRRIENAMVREISAQYSLEDQKRLLNNQLENTLATYNNQKRILGLAEELVANARENLRIAEERFKGGLITSFDYRTIQLGYINASQSRLNAFFNLKATETDLIRLTGGLVR